jgi:hypothetical protein
VLNESKMLRITVNINATGVMPQPRTNAHLNMQGNHLASKSTIAST